MNTHNSKEIIICNWCGQPSNIIWVHGHGQCSSCGINVDECCRGEICEFPLNKETPNQNPAEEDSDD